MTRHIIIGGDAAGMSAAMQIRRADKDAQIWAFEMGGTFSYAQCGLPYYIGGVSDRDKLIALTEQTFNERYQIKAKSFHKVTGIDPVHKRVNVLDLQNNSSSEYSYDQLLIATGASPITVDQTGLNKEGVFYLKTLQDADQIKSYIEKNKVKSACIIGAGYIGLEMAENFVRQNIDVTILQRGSYIGGALDEDMAQHVEKEIEKHLKLHLSENVRSIDKRSHALVISTDNQEYKADIVLIAIGVSPNSELAIDAGITTGLRNAIVVNERMETNIPGIYAAGDCALQYHRLKEKLDYIPLGTNANKQGNIAGINMAGGGETFAGVVGTAIFKVFELEVGRVGLNEKEAQTEGIPYESISIKAADKAGYYPGMQRMFVKLLFNSETHQVLGGQFVGYQNVAKQVDVLASALHQNFSVKQLLELDLAYAPPFSTVWSPIQQAARKI